MRPLDLGVAAMPDQDGFDAFAAVAADLHVYLGDQRAGGVENLELAASGFAVAPCLETPWALKMT